MELQFIVFGMETRADLQPGVPYDIPKVTASLFNVQLPDYGQRATLSNTIR